MPDPKYTDPTIYAVAAVLYEDTSLTFADIGQRLGGLAEGQVTGIMSALRADSALTFRRRKPPAGSLPPAPLGDKLARLIGQSKEQAELLRHLRRYGWTFEYTGGGHVRCLGPQGQIEIVSSRAGPAAREQFRKHGVTWPGDPQPTDKSLTIVIADPAPPNPTVPANAPMPETADGTTEIPPVEMPAADLTLELVARSVDSLVELFEVLSSEVGDLRERIDSAVEQTQGTLRDEDNLRTRVEALEANTAVLASRIANVDPIGSLRAALRGRDQPRT